MLDPIHIDSNEHDNYYRRNIKTDDNRYVYVVSVLLKDGDRKTIGATLRESQTKKMFDHFKNRGDLWGIVDDLFEVEKVELKGAW